MGSFNNTLIEKFLSGDRLALSKTISLVENNNNNSVDLLNSLYLKIGHAYRLGITGPPGAGKSTLVDEMTKFYRKQDKTIGIIAVDPTSPFTGGALLGDRIRMQDLFLDEGVFIRSMATRGSLGGLSQKADDAADIMDAFGKDYVILETVGVGQSELDVVEVADTTIVVLVPESGDSIQAMKAGLMEIADIFILNKADREGAERAIEEIRAMLHLRPQSEWAPKVLPAVANRGEGIKEIAEVIASHRDYLINKNKLNLKRQERIIKKIRSIVCSRLEEAFWDESTKQMLKRKVTDEMESSPYKIAKQLLKNFKRKLEKCNE